MPLYLWQPNGKIRFRAVNTETGAPTSASLFSVEGTYDPQPLGFTGLVVGNEYRLQYYLDCIPDVSGYVEEWLNTPVVWTQPHKDDPPFEHELNFGE